MNIKKEEFLNEYIELCKKYDFYIVYSFSDEPFIADLDDNDLFDFYINNIRNNN